MSDYSELINYLQRRTASDEELRAAEAITTPQRQLAEANTDRDAWERRFDSLAKTSLNVAQRDQKQVSALQQTIADQHDVIWKLREKLMANQNWLSIFATRRKLTDHDLRIIKRLRDDNGASLTEGGE